MQPGKPLRVVHVTFRKVMTPGVRKQVSWERSASDRLTGVEWASVALHCGEPVEDFEKRVPIFLRPMFLRNFYAWLIVIRMARTHDVVLLRHIAFDPFALIFAPFIRNRVSVHHSREWEELPLIRPGLAGRLAGALERVTGKVAVRCTMGVLGVTNEIAQFQVNIRAPGKPAGLYANGIDLETVAMVDDRRDAETVQVVFMSNTFNEWHGLDRLVDAVRRAPSIHERLVIHLIGKISKSQRENIEALGDRAQVFSIHGFLETQAYSTLLAQADAGLGSLAMDRQNLNEGATLKVREMLGMGLPVFSGHTDTVLSTDFPFYLKVSQINIKELEQFAREMKRHSRSEVRAAATPFIEKSATMQVAANWLKTLCSKNFRKSYTK